MMADVGAVSNFTDKAFFESELEKCIVTQDKIFQSDLDELAEGRIKDGGQFYKRMRIYMNYNTQE